MKTDNNIEREHMLVKVRNTTESRAELKSAADLYHASIVEMNKCFTVLQKTGTTEETAHLYDELKPYGILQFIRSGRIAISRAEQEPVVKFLRKRERVKKQLN